MQLTPETINQYGFLGAALGTFFGAIVTVLAYKGVPAFFEYLNKRAQLSLQADELENQTQQVENKKDLATVQLAQVIADENTELREIKRLQASQIIEQANEISRLKNYELAVDELRDQRQKLLTLIITGGYLDQETLIQQLKNDVLIMETMLNTDYKG